MKYLISVFSLIFMFSLSSRAHLIAADFPSGQEAVEKSAFTAKELKEDFLQLRQAFESMHPAKYK